MKRNYCINVSKSILVAITLLCSFGAFAQGQTYTPKPQSEFWRHVQFGGGIGLNFSSGYTDVYLAPSAIYNFNPIFALGAGLNLNYVSSNYYSSTIYGINTLVLINPVPQIQLSIGLNESRVNYQETGNYSSDYWNTSLILGAGYRTGNVTVGVGYNVLQNDPYYTTPFMPFVRVYF